MSSRRELLEALYQSFNARDIEAVLAGLHPDIEWPNGWEGGYVHGHTGIRDYWTRQWAAISPLVEPVGFFEEQDGRIGVNVRQTIRDLAGEILDRANLRHIYTFDGDLILRMELA